MSNLTPHTRQSLGVPDWFICDGCSHSPDNRWLTPACVKHDWDYFRGTVEGAGEGIYRLFRRWADRDLRANIKHNAKATAEGWLDRLWRPPLGELYYLAVTKFGRRSFRVWPSGPPRGDWRLYAIPAGKYDPAGDPDALEVATEYTDWFQGT